MEKPRLAVHLDIGISICIISISIGESLKISKNLSITFHQHKKSLFDDPEQQIELHLQLRHHPDRLDHLKRKFFSQLFNNLTKYDFMGVYVEM